MRADGGQQLPHLVLWLTVPIVVLAMASSAAGLWWPTAYEAETVNWATQGRGQDAVNLLVCPALLVLAVRATRGSVPALLGWIGLAIYSAYSYLLYAGWVHFGPLFLVHVAVCGLSTWAVIVGLALVDQDRLHTYVAPTLPNRRVGTALASLGGLFALLWLAEIVPSLLDGTTPQTLAETGLASNPVWILDLALVLPAMVVAGVLLRRDRALGHLLAGPILTFGVAMGVAIIGMVVALTVTGEGAAIVPAVMMGLVVAVEVWLLVVLHRHLRVDATTSDVLRTSGSTEVTPATSSRSFATTRR